MHQVWESGAQEGSRANLDSSLDAEQDRWAHQVGRQQRVFRATHDSVTCRLQVQFEEDIITARYATQFRRLRASGSYRQHQRELRQRRLRLQAGRDRRRDHSERA